MSFRAVDDWQMAVIKSIHKRYRKLAIMSRRNKDKNRKAHINENFNGEKQFDHNDKQNNGF
jgi:hypothetical protein